MLSEYEQTLALISFSNYLRLHQGCWVWIAHDEWQAHRELHAGTFKTLKSLQERLQAVKSAIHQEGPLAYKQEVAYLVEQIELVMDQLYASLKADVLSARRQTA